MDPTDSPDNLEPFHLYNDSFQENAADMDHPDVFPLLDNMTNTNMDNFSDPENVTVFCSNEYCATDEEYIDMILDYIYPEPFEWLLITAYAIVFIVGIIGNFLVCFAVCRNKGMRTVTNYFIVNLAVADFLVVLICLPPTVLEDIAQTWFMGNIGCKVVKYLQAVTVCVSILTLSCISVERFYAICQPLKFKATPSRTRLLIVVIWLVALVMMTPELIFLDTTVNKPVTVLLTSCHSTWEQREQTGYQVFMLIAMYILPFGLMFVFYIQIAKCLWSTKIPTETSRDQLHPKDCMYRSSQSTTNSASENQLMSRRKVAKMLISVVILFGICYLPVHLLSILRYTGVIKTWSETVITSYALTAHWLCYFNSAINPVIYNFMSTKFRREFRNACICCTLCCKEDRRLANHSRVMQSYRYQNVMVNGTRQQCPPISRNRTGL